MPDPVLLAWHWAKLVLWVCVLLASMAMAAQIAGLFGRSRLRAVVADFLDCGTLRLIVLVLLASDWLQFIAMRRVLTAVAIAAVTLLVVIAARATAGRRLTHADFLDIATSGAAVVSYLVLRPHGTVALAVLPPYLVAQWAIWRFRRTRPSGSVPP